ncbi:MAG TPA: adenylate/guanylate cyclase domain-containing protein [Candidatus Ozemobacteraceae bacterium]|nr:adenylate/guanylate cyclase domain-containing protein [Candidatus Ozemobacteraceae bacterium]
MSNAETACTAPPGPADRRPEGRRKSLTWAAVFFLIVVVLPAAGLWHLTSRFEASTDAAREAECREKARELVMRLRSALDRNIVITEKLGLFRRSVLAERRGRAIDEASASLHDAKIRRFFPADTQIHWFDASDRMIPVAGRPVPPGQRAWQAFLRAIRSETGVSATELSLAQSFFKKTFGSIATLSYLRRSRTQATEVLIGGKLHSLAIVVFNAGRPAKRRLGSCIVIAPVYRAKQGWELERAIRLLSGEETAIGGLWQIAGDGPAAEPLSPGMLHGLGQQLERGQSVYLTAEWFIYSIIYDKNPDLLLTVAIRTPAKSRWVTTATTASRGLLSATVLAAGFALFALGAGWWHPRLNLEAKFKIAAAALTVPTLLAMALLGLEHLNRLSQSQTEGLLKQLESQLAGVEQKVASELGRLENLLLVVSRSAELASVGSTAAFERQLAPFLQSGLSRAVLVFRDGRSYEFHVADSKTSWGMLDAIGKRTMQYYGFKVQKMPNERPFPAEFEVLFPEKSIDDHNQALFDKLTPIQFASQKTVIFQAFFRGKADKKPLGFFNVHFDLSNLNTLMMGRALSEMRRQGVKLAVLGDVPSTNLYIGSNRKIRKILDLVRFTGQPVQTTLEFRDRPWLVRARPLKGIDAAGISLIRADVTDPSWSATAALLFLFAFGGAMASLWSVQQLRALLIEPMSALLIAVRRVEGGDYKTRIVSTANDELGVLIRRLGVLVQGLRHKARMTPFLRADLVESAATHTPDPGSRRPVTVLFAGLRGFGDVEARLEPEEAMQVMSRYLGLCESAVLRHGGEIDKFIGDTAMAIYREGPDLPPTGLRAARTALEIDREMERWMAEEGDMPGGRLRHGVGFASGSPVVGHVGSLRKRLDATAIGDTVNLAARLEKLAGRDRHPSALTTTATIAGLPGEIVPVPTGIHGVRGRQEAVQVVGIRRPAHE